jgi:hypothetical protein
MVRASKPYEERWSTDEVQECVELWSLTKDEHHKLLELKAKIKDIDHWKNDPFEVVRFLKEFKFDVTTTETKFRTSIQWRLENNADFILEEYTPPALYNYFPLGVIEGADRDGQPIYIERSGVADAYGLLLRFGKDEMIQQAIWSKELLSRGPWQEEWPTRITAFLTILDLKGLNRHHLNPHLIPVGQAVTRLTQDNYPGFGKVRTVMPQSDTDMEVPAHVSCMRVGFVENPGHPSTLYLSVCVEHFQAFCRPTRQGVD